MSVLLRKQEPRAQRQCHIALGSCFRRSTATLLAQLMRTIAPDDLSSPQTRDLVAYHLREMHRHSPPGSVFALDLSGLQSPDITLWSLREGDALLGIGALKALPDRTGEIKSMRTHPDHLRKGVARILLEHIIDEARLRKMTRLSLETGSGPAFEPALALYRARGFINGPAFGAYEKSPFNQFLHLSLGHTE